MDFLPLVLAKSWLAAGTANALTSALLHPLDRTRVVVQLSPTGPGLFSSLRAQFTHGGFSALWLPGLSASILREYLYSGPRVGLYVPCRDMLASLGGIDPSSFLLKIATGVCTGTVSCVISNPVDVVKIRLMQNPSAYSGTLSALPAILGAEGWRGLYKGLAPSTVRGAAITVGQISAYDIAKLELRTGLGMSEGPALHVTASLIAGVCAAVLAAPFDTIKSHAMVSSSTGKPQSTRDIARGILAQGGPLALFRGVLPAYLRQGPHVLICLPLTEQLRGALGLKYI
jgi:solute carrier family 25 uncoupling protein 8/9